MKDIKDYLILNDSQLGNYAGDHYPDGRAWANKYNSLSYLYKFIQCIDAPFKHIFNLIYIIAKNTDSDYADELLDRWEKDSAVPDIFSRLDTVEKRKEAVKRIQSKIPVVNIRNDEIFSWFVPNDMPYNLSPDILLSSFDDDTAYENYVKKVLDLDIAITAGNQTSNTANFPLKFPIKFGVPWKERQFTLYIEILGMEYPYSETVIRKLNKVLDFILPTYYLRTYI